MILPELPSALQVGVLAVVGLCFVAGASATICWSLASTPRHRSALGLVVHAAATAAVAALAYTVVNKQPSPLYWALAALGIASLIAINATDRPDSAAALARPGWRFGAISVLAMAASATLGAHWAKLKVHREHSGVLAASVNASLLQRNGAPTYGSPDAALQVVVFSDPVCPACLKTVPKIISEAKDGSQGQFRLTYRQFPLPIHRQARDLSLVEVWASKKGAFDAVRNLISEEKGVEESVLKDLPRIGLKEAEAREIIRGSSREALACQAIVDKDLADGWALSVRGTPTFFIVAPQEPIKWFTGSPRLPVLK